MPPSPPPPSPPRFQTVPAGSVSRVCLIPHLGLGDMFVLNGLIRHTCETYDDVLMFAKRAYAGTLRLLFADLPNLRLWFVDEYPDLYADGARALREAVARGYALMPLGVHAQYLGAPSAGWRALDPQWTRALYAQAGLDPGLMFSGFRATRSTIEDKLHERVEKLLGCTYVVVHDDPSRGQVLDSSRLPAGVPWIHVDDPRIRTDNVLDYARVIDNALEFHGIDSCFLWMAAFMCPKVRKVCHAYVKDPQIPADLWGRRERGNRPRVDVWRA